MISLIANEEGLKCIGASRRCCRNCYDHGDASQRKHHGREYECHGDADVDDDDDHVRIRLITRRRRKKEEDHEEKHEPNAEEHD